jgi:hypothetical protein
MNEKLDAQPTSLLSEMIHHPFWKSKWLFAILCIGFLWVFGAGDFGLLFLRSLIVFAIFLPLTWQEFKLHKQELCSKKFFLQGLSVGVGTGILFFALRYASTFFEPSIYLGGGLWGWIQSLTTALQNHSSVLIFLGGVLMSIPWAIVSRKYLQRDWGLGGVAFLDAVAVGMASQNAGMFFAVFGFGYIWGWIFKSGNFGLTLWTQVWSFSMFLLALSI